MDSSREEAGPSRTVRILKSWIIDSGASDHMCNDKRIFKNLKALTCEIGVAKESEKMTAEALGVVECDFFILRDVLYVPDLAQNIISVQNITKNGGAAHFNENHGFLFVENNVIMKCFKDGQTRLYHLDLKHDAIVTPGEEQAPEPILNTKIFLISVIEEDNDVEVTSVRIQEATQMINWEDMEVSSTTQDIELKDLEEAVMIAKKLYKKKDDDSDSE